MKTNVSVRYGTDCISLPDPIKMLEKRLPTFHDCLPVGHKKEQKRKRNPWCGQVTVSIYLPAVNSSDLPSSRLFRLEADTDMA